MELKYEFILGYTVLLVPNIVTFEFDEFVINEVLNQTYDHQL